MCGYDRRVDTKSGYKTSEFWLSLVATGLMVAVATGAITPAASAEVQQTVQAVAAGAAAVIPGLYAMARAVTKAFTRR